MQPELVSVIMPVKNAAATVDAAIRSVSMQSWPHWELLIVDDGSTDQSVDVVHDWRARDARVSLCAQTPGLGPAAARNLAVQAANGRYLAFLDADDLWVSDKLQRQLQVMRETGAPLSFSSYVQFHDGKNHGWLYRAPQSTSYADMLGGSVIGCLTVLIDKQILGSPQFDDARETLARTPWRHLYAYIGHEDYTAWMRLLAKIETGGLPPPVGLVEPLAFHRLRAGSFSASKWRVAGYQFFILRHLLGLSFSSAVRCFLRYAWRSSRKRFDRRHSVPLPEFV